MCLSNLMLTGTAVPYLHNGIMSADVDDATNFDYGEGKVGITGRNDIGFLFWMNTEEETMDFNLGSRLKTPVLPIWVTCINDEWGVLFNPNKDLMKSYAAENRSFMKDSLVQVKIDLFVLQVQLVLLQQHGNQGEEGHHHSDRHEERNQSEGQC